MILENERNTITVSAAKVFENCIKNYLNKTHELYMWLPNIDKIIVTDNETLIRFKNETEEISLGFTAIEWVFNDYVDSSCKGVNM